MIAPIIHLFLYSDFPFQDKLVEKCRNGNSIGYVEFVELPVQCRFSGHVERVRIQQYKTGPKGC